MDGMVPIQRSDRRQGMRYKVMYTDGSSEIVSGASDIGEARQLAKEVYDLAPVQNVVAIDDHDEDEDDDDDDEDDDEDDEDAKNPAGDDEGEEK
jgi:hypothetical protein